MERATIELKSGIYSVYYTDDVSNEDGFCEKHQIAGVKRVLCEVSEIFNAKTTLAISLKSPIGRQLIRKLREKINKECICCKCEEEMYFDGVETGFVNDGLEEEILNYIK